MIKDDERSAPPRPVRTGLRGRSRGPRAGRWAVLLAAFVCAACGLVYELELVALGSYLLGNSVTQASVVLSVMVCAMGLGSLLAKHFTRRAATAFAVVESALALSGGLSVIALYGCFVWIGHYQAALVVVAALIGLLIGAEIPLLMTLIQRIRRQDASRAVADLFAADYVGALVGGLAFPFLLLPTVGQLDGALLTGTVNACAGTLVALWLFGAEPPARTRLLLCMLSGTVVLALSLAWALSGAFERAARTSLYGSSVLASRQSGYQEIVLSGGDDRAGAADRAGSGRPLRLYLDGQLRLCSADRPRYLDALLGPALSRLTGRRLRVLVLGGGDGTVAASLLADPRTEHVTVVESDPAVLQLARTDRRLTALNRRALDDPRVRTATADPFDWLRTAPRQYRSYDLVVAQLPDPAQDQSRKFYSQEFYGLVSRVLAPGGRLVVDAGDPAAAGYRDADRTLRSLGLHSVAYAVPSGPDRCDGSPEWGLLLAGRERQGTPPLPAGARLRPPGPGAHVTTLLHPR
ncbi:polyamine aminopropyltransferase [Streptacidiphilus monticola]|uniref:Polyamine aminopropyltransferase n=1 Tax=Streptacidiphilus monticola TaxID=2161674 RepID=A0ABW1G5D9_9ACTN